MKTFSTVRSYFSALFLAALFLGLQGCGGGGSNPPVVVPDANPAGYYTGTAAVKTPTDDTTNYPISDLQIMISGNRIMMMSDANSVLYDGTFTVTGNDLTSTVSIYYNGNKQSGPAGTATLNATITEGSQITGSFTGTELGNGTFVSTFSNLSNTASSLTQVNNNFWRTALNESTSYNFEFELRATSVLLESTAPFDPTFANCRTLTGSTYEPIANSSLFEVTIVFGTCTNSAVDGTYTGFSQAKNSNNVNSNGF